MTYLHYYDKEQKSLPEAYATKLDDLEARYVYARLQSHYGFKQDLEIKHWDQSGVCNDWKIRVSHSPSVGLLSHEIGHAIHRMEGRYSGEKKHTKHLLGIVRRVSTYTLNNLPEWREVLGHKATLKEQRTLQRIRKLETIVQYKNSPQGKLDTLRKLETRWLTRKKRAETRLKRIQRRIKIWEKKVQNVGCV